MGGRRSTALDTIISIVYPIAEVEVNAYMRVEVNRMKRVDLSKEFRNRFGGETYGGSPQQAAVVKAGERFL